MYTGEKKIIVIKRCIQVLYFFFTITSICMKLLNKSKCFIIVWKSLSMMYSIQFWIFEMNNFTQVTVANVRYGIMEL